MIRFVKKRFIAPLFKNETGDDTKIDLLWGDRVRVINSSGARLKVKARGVTGFMEAGHIGNKSLLEFYFIDVGQGDGVFMRTPDDRHILIDGGWPRERQPTGKNAADFVDWKYFVDYENKNLELDVMICSHNDQDHYGGLWDLLDKDQHEELDTETVAVENFYHAGLSWWKGASRNLGPSATTSKGPIWTRLLEDRDSLEAGLKSSGAGAKFQGEWAKFLRKVKDAKTKSGDPTPVSRLSDTVGFLPGFDESNDVTIRILAPVDINEGGKSGIRKLKGGTSKNTNGNSVLLRVDYKSSRVLLTGDLNTVSQQSLLDDYEGNHEVFACDVAKACHHGADDVSIKFLQTIEPACTIISSGDSEGHDHPRPNIVAASGLTGFKTIEEDRLVTPLVFSTELARGIDLGRVTKIEKRRADGTVISSDSGEDLEDYRLSYKIVQAGARGAKSGSSRLSDRRIAAKTTYGLINVRTDGKTIMCAALNEKEFKWNVTVFKSRFTS